MFSSMEGNGLVWALVALTAFVALYLMREPAHAAILSLARVLHGAFRLAAASLNRAERRLAARNHEVLLAAGREQTEHIIEREFERMEKHITKDLGDCPALQRRMNEQISRIEEDHQRSTDVPPAPPAWTEAVDAVANIPSKGDPMVANILDKIHESLVEALATVRADYRDATKGRHEQLKNMRPAWRQLQQNVTAMDKDMLSLLKRAKDIDRHMDRYEEIIKGTDRATQTLSSSSLVMFFISGLVLAIAAAGAGINFNLIARPMAEMVGGTNTIGIFKVADIAAMVIILVETSMGLFLMESLRFTRLFPAISALPDKMRVRLMWVSFSILLGLALVEVGLAYMRDVLLMDELATSAMLREGGSALAGATEFQWITTSAQMGIGFILPFALAFVAIPLEYFVHALRNVLGLGVGGLLRALAMLLRILGSIIRHTGRILVDFYDIIIFPAIWVERRIIKPAAANTQAPRRNRKSAAAQ
jgi:phage shock protein A